MRQGVDPVKITPNKVPVGAKFAALITVFTALVMAISVAVVMQRFKAQDDARSKQAAQVTAAGIGAAVQTVFEDAFDIVGTTHDNLIALRDAGVTDPKVYDTLLERMIQSAPDRYGAWLVWDYGDAPIAAGPAPAPRLSVYWHQNGMAMLRDVVPPEILASDLFKVPTSEDKPYLLEPHAIDAENGDPVLVTSFAKPLDHDGKVVGALAIDIKLDAIADALGAIKMPGGATVTVVSDGGMVAMSTDKSLTGQQLRVARPDAWQILLTAKRDGDGSRLAPVSAGTAQALTAWNAIRFAGVKNPWYVIMEIPQRSLLETTSDDRLFLLLIATGALLAVLLVVLLAMSRLVSKPLADLSAIIVGLGAGLFDFKIPSRHRADEIGDIARAVERLQDSGLEIARLREINGEAEFQRLAKRRSDLDGISRQFSGSIESLVTALESVASTVDARSREVSLQTEAAAQQLGEVAGASNASRASMGSVATATASLLTTINAIGDRTRDSGAAVLTVERHAISAGAAMADLSQAISDIGLASKLIGEVAAQINLIALNATIEAARSGEAGRGFAVVAQEIKVLAKRTATATDQIGSAIAVVHQASGVTEGKVGEMREAVADMRRISGEIAGALEIQLGATSEIGALMETALDGGEAAARHVAGLVRSAAEVQQAATVMNAESTSLGAQILRLRAEVEDFLGFLRAA